MTYVGTLMLDNTNISKKKKLFNTVEKHKEI